MVGSKNKSSIVIERIVLVFFGIAIAVLISELGLRVQRLVRHAIHTASEKPTFAINDAYDKKDVYKEKFDLFALMRFSCYLAFYPSEGHRGKGYITNKYGFRYDDDFPIRKPDDEIRIFITGGSTAWGWGVNQDDLYASLAEKALQDSFPDKKVRVVSTGVVSYLSTHEKILVLNKIKDFGPDVVLMFSGFNDIYAGYTGFSAVDDKWDYLEAAPLLAKYNGYYSLDDQNIINDIYPPRYGDYALKTHYYLDRFIYGLQGREGLEKSINEIRIDRDIILEHLEDNVRTIVDASKRDDFTCVFYLQPSLLNTKKKLSPAEASFKDSARVWFVGYPEYNSSVYDLYRIRLPLLAKEEGFIFADGDEAVSHETKTVFTDQVHFGDRGNRLVAKHMAGILTELLKTGTVADRRN